MVNSSAFEGLMDCSKKNNINMSDSMWGMRLSTEAQLSHLLQHALKPLSFLLGIVTAFLQDFLCNGYIDLSMPDQTHRTQYYQNVTKLKKAMYM